MSISSVKPLDLQHPDGVTQISFRWIDDRFHHQIIRNDVRATSVEGDAKEAWPDSPPTQQLSIEPIEGRSVALGVGCAGTSHWSLSVEPIDGGFRFDWACKTKDTPDKLGTRYQTGDGVHVRPAEDAVSKDAEGGVSIVPAEMPPSAGTFRWRYDVILD